MITFGIVTVYLLGTLSMGHLIKRKRIGKDTTIHKLFVADGKLSLFAITALLFGDMIAGSSTTGTAGTGYSLGLAGGWGVWGNSFGCIVFSVCFCDFFFRIRKTGITTEPEAFGLRFNQKIRYLTLLFTLIPLFIILSAQISAGSMYISNMLNAPSIFSTILAASIFLAMALLGSSGIAEMNKLHSFVLFFGMALAAIVCLVYVGGPTTLINELPSSYFNPFVNGPLTVAAQFLGSALGFSISVTSINIGFSAKNIAIAKKCHWITAFLCTAFAVFPLTIGLCGAATLEGIIPDTALFAMTFHISPVLSGVAVMAVFAAIFSTGPWFLLASANLIVRDIFMPAAKARGKDIASRKAVSLSRVIMCVVLVGATAASGQNMSLLDTLMGAAQIKAILAILLMVGVYWKRLTNKMAFAGLLGGGTMSTIWYFSGYPLGIQPLWPGLIISLFIFIVGSLLTNRNKVSDDYEKYEEQLSEAIRAYEKTKKQDDAHSESSEAGRA